MRDFYPDDKRRENALFSLWRSAALSHGFEEYDAPVVETEELLKRKSGEDIVRQIYNFTDKSGRALALRPEMTPSLARMIIARQSSLSFPIKWFSIPQCFRYERTTRGRKREHFQWNLDIVGEECVSAEAEVLSAAISALTAAGMTSEQFKVRVGDRGLLEKLFAASGVSTGHFGSVCLALDKRDKISEKEMTALLEKEGMAPESIDKTFVLLEIESVNDAAALMDSDEPLGEIRELFELMNSYGMEEFLKFDLSIIRGLDYYTGIVFEAFDVKGKFRAIFGGGRYDNLLSALGGRKVPSVGLGFGDVVVFELMDHLGIDIGRESRLDVLVGYMSEDEREIAMQGAAALRRNGLTVDLKLKPLKPKKLFSSASKAGAAFAVFAGHAEREKGVLVVKNLETGEQDTAEPERLSGKVKP